MRIKVLCFSAFILFFFNLSNAQNNVGIRTTTPHASAVLDLITNEHGLLEQQIPDAKLVEVTKEKKALISVQIFLDNPKTKGCFIKRNIICRVSK